MRESVALWGSQSRGGIAKPVVVVFLWIAEEGIVESKNMFRFGMSSQARVLHRIHESNLEAQAARARFTGLQVLAGG